MANGTETEFVPLVTSATTAQSLNIGSIMDELEDRKLTIPDYQRDSSQWNNAKKSLFIESIINGLTIPPLIVYPEDNVTGRGPAEIRYVIDGQQRLTTIQEYLQDRFSLSDEDDVEYAENVGPLIKTRKFSGLPSKVQRTIRTYTVNLIVLPKNLERSLRLEVFRRINEGGVPLSPHDLRLATFDGSERVWFIRLAGIFDPEREGARRMLSAAQERYKLAYPWQDHRVWKSWWRDSVQSVGQAPSELFLYYVIARDLAGLDNLLSSEKARQALDVKFDKTTASLLDLYCAQLERESIGPKVAQLLVRPDILRSWFEDFEHWFNTLIAVKGIQVPLNSSRKLALFIAAASEVWKTPDTVTASQWNLIQVFLTEGPTEIKKVIGLAYAIARGKWQGQRKQIGATIEICRLISGK